MGVNEISQVDNEQSLLANFLKSLESHLKGISRNTAKLPRVDFDTFQSAFVENSITLSPQVMGAYVITDVIAVWPPSASLVTIKIGSRNIQPPPASGEFILADVRGMMVDNDHTVSLAVVPGSNPTPSQPAVPASTVAVQNTNSYPVNVVISGGTITQVLVNGIVVGTGAGTYLVSSGGSISITYSVAPTWVWSNANPAPASQLPIFFNIQGYSDSRKMQ